MKTVYLHGKLGKRFGEKWDLNVDTAQEAYSAIDANSDGFMQYIIDASKKGTEYIALTKDPKHIQDEKDLRENIIDLKNVNLKSKNKEIHVLNPVSGSGPAAVVFYALASFMGGGAIYGVTLKTVLAIAALTAVVQSLTKPPKPPERKDPVSTKSFLISGGLTRQAQGIAVPLGYGRLKIGATNVATRKTSKQLTTSDKPGTLESYTEMEFVDLLCEGPIEGFVNKHGATLANDNIFEGIYLNDVQLKNTPKNASEEGTYNYILNEEQDTDAGAPKFKTGADDESKFLSNGVFSIKEYDILIYGPPPYGSNKRYKTSGGSTEVTRYLLSSALSNEAKIISHQVSNSSVGKVIISFRAELSSQKDDGEVQENEVSFAILMSRSDGEYNVLHPDSQCIISSPSSNGVSEETNSSASNNNDKNYFKLTGIATGTYQFDINIYFSNTLNLSEVSEGVTFKIVKLSPEYDPSVKGGNVGGITRTRRLQLAHVVEEIEQNLLYPHSAMARILVDSKNFSNVPDRSYHIKMKKVLIPENYNPQTREYDGPWNGLFKGQADSSESIHSIPDSNKYWTDNPAWIFFDLLHNCRYGVGKYGLEEENIDKWQLYKIAKYCDELVETDYPIETKSGNPRSFSATANNRVVQIDSGEYIYENKYTNPTLSIGLYQTYIGRPTSSRVTQQDKDQFAEEFGSGESFKGKRIAFFVHESNQPLSDADQRYKSAARVGKIKIYERVIQKSDVNGFTVTLDQPLSSGNIIGACATQINHSVVEPRFTANLYLTDRAEALEVMKNLASVFRGMVAYSGGQIMSLQDNYKKPVQLFNNSNVSSEGFTYVGIHKNKRITVSLVRFNNSSKNYKPDLVYEEDADAIQKFGYIENETMGLGVTSESQARRFAKWILLTSQLETETIQFTAGQEASYLFPGAIFEVSDEMRTGNSRSGRILDIGYQRNIVIDGTTYSSETPYFLIDKSIVDDPVLAKVEITVCVGEKNITQEQLNLRAPFERSEDDQDAEIDQVFAPQIYKFEATMGLSESIKPGPQGQISIAYDLLLKIQIELDVPENMFISSDHGFENGNRVEFKSDGVLPAGLIAGKIYYVINRTKHTFQVSESSSGNVAVEILDAGKDFLLNDGGLHYVCPYSTGSSMNARTKIAMDQVTIGTPYSIKGIIGVETSDVITGSLIDSRLRVTETFPNGWKKSIFFGYFLMKDTHGGWMFSANLNQWLYVKQIVDGDSFWVYSPDSLGWCYIYEKTRNEFFWYIYDTGQWMFVNKNASYFFLFESNPTLSVGSSSYLNQKKFYIQKVKTGAAGQSGYFIHFTESPNKLGNQYVGTYVQQTIDRNSNPGSVSAGIADIVAVDAAESIQGRAAIRLIFNSGHGIDLRRNNTLEVYTISTNNSVFNSNMLREWNTIYVNNNAVELVSSESEAGLSFTFNSGEIRYDRGLTSLNQRYLEGQLFRTISVKEISENKYEVAGLEYNASKFDSVDKKGVVKKPHLPIPPQADMAVPEAPSNLVLFNLSF